MEAEKFRESLRLHLNAPVAPGDAAAYELNPLSSQELSLMEIEQGSPAEDWSDWETR